MIPGVLSLAGGAREGQAFSPILSEIAASMLSGSPIQRCGHTVAAARGISREGHLWEARCERLRIKLYDILMIDLWSPLQWLQLRFIPHR